MIPIHPLAEIFPPLEGEAFAALKADIEANGLSVPITLWRGSIIDGRNRYRAMVELGRVPRDAGTEAFSRPDIIPCETIDGLGAHDLPAFVISRNLTRRHLNESQRALVAARLSEMSRPGRPAKAGKAIVAAPSPRPADAGPPSPARGEGAQAGDAESPPIGGVSGAMPALTTGAAAEMLNVSPRSVERARVLFTGPIEMIGEVEAGKLPVSRAAHLVKQAAAAAEPGEDIATTYARLRDMAAADKARKTAEKQAKRAAREAALGERLATSNDSLVALGQGRKFGVILADPEWEHEPWSEAGLGKAAANHYPVSPLDEIKARPIAAIAAPHCVLLMWTTVPHLAQAMEVIAAWGFDYRSNLIWRKIYPGARQGMGYWSRVNHEILIIATRGKVPAPAPGTQWGSVQDAPVGEHSEKPDFAHRYAEEFWPNLPKIELNARTARPGWEAWGAEADFETPPAPPERPGLDGPSHEARCNLGAGGAPDEGDGSPSPRPADAGDFSPSSGADAPPSPARGEGEAGAPPSARLGGGADGGGMPP